ncbi:putative ribonuclease H-like domain-containing protein, partial [Tanacetum coccineum]
MVQENVNAYVEGEEDGSQMICLGWGWKDKIGLEVDCNYHQKQFQNQRMNLIPRAVLMKSGLVSVNTARQVNIAHSKIIVNAARPMSYLSNIAHSTVKRPIHKNTTLKTVILIKRISGKGKIKTETLDFDNVYFCKELKYNLFSVSQIYDKKNNVLFTNTECLVLSSDFKRLDESQVLLRIPRKDNIYSVDLKSVVPTKGLTCLFAKDTIDESNLWHRRLGRTNFKNMNKLVRGNLVRCLPSKIFENDHSCVACQKRKQYKASCKAKLVNSISKPLHMLHMALLGLTNVKSLMKKSYCLVVTDDFSRFSWVFFLATKDETSRILKTFITEIENQLDHKVKVIRSDNGTEFKNSVMNQFCEIKGIKREFSVARTPQQNGVAKRRNRTLIEAARTILVYSKLPTTFWAEAVNTACYVLNRVLVIKPHNKTYYELIRGRTLLIDFIKPFGCPVTILNTRDHLGKFDGKVDEGFLLGNGPDWLFDVDSLTISMNYVPVVAGTQPNGIAGTRDNIIIEDSGMKPTEMDESRALDKDGEDDQATRSEFKRLLQQEKQTVHPNNTNSINTVSTHVSTVGPSCTDDDLSSPVNAAEASNEFEEHLFEQFSPFKNAFTLPPILNVTPMNDTGIFGNAYDDKDVGAEAVLNNLETTMNVRPILTTRIDKDHPKYHIIVDFNSAIQTRRMTKIFDEHAMVCYINKQRRRNHEDYQNYLFACFLSQMEPKKVIQALEDPNWIEAMQEELLQFQIQKARLVAQGYTQAEGIDYDEVFAPVAKIEVIRLFLAYASFMGFIMYQMDVKSAFVYGTIEEEVYVCQPPGFEDPQFPNKVYKVEKALYGLHQAPRAWYETLSTYLIKNGFRKGTINKTLFIKKDKGDILLVQVYVDDIIFGSTKKYLCDKFEGVMHKRFQMSSMGELTFFLGLQVQQKKDVIFISQDKYVVEILKKFIFATVKTANTSMEPNKALVKDEEADRVDVHLYRLMIGSLMYLAASRLDIMFVVCACARMKLLGLVSAAYMGLVMRLMIIIGFLLFWNTATSKTVNSVKQIHAIVDSKVVVISESSVRSDLLFHDKDGIACLTNDEIFENLALMVYEQLSTKLTFQKGKVTPLFDSMLVQNQALEGEGGDSIERAITTDVSLVAAQDIDNIIRTQTTAMPNVDIPHGIDTGGSLKRQETMGVLDLEKEKDAQAVEILKLKQRVKKLERNRNSSISHPRRRIYRQVESSDDDLDKENASKQGRERETVHTATTGVSAASAPVTTAGVAISTAEPRTPPTTAATAF